MNYSKKMIVLGCSFWYAKAKYITFCEKEASPEKLQLYIKATGNFWFRLLNECDGDIVLCNNVITHCLSLITDLKKDITYGS